MSDTPGGAPGRSSRPDLEPTINEAGASGFVVDGTDSFAVPGPSDATSTADDQVPPPSVDRTRLFVTMAAVAAGLLFVVAIGRGGSGAAEDAQLRTGQDGGPEYTLPFWNDDVESGDEVVGAPPGPIDDDTLRLLEESGQLDVERRFFDQDELLIEDELATVTMPTYDVGDFDDTDFDDLDDEGFPTYRPLTTVPRRATTTSRRSPVATTSRVTIPRAVAGDDDDEDGSTTTTTQAPADTSTSTSTTSTTTTTTSTTTTTTSPALAWVQSGTVPETCAEPRLWAMGDGLASTSGGGLRMWSPSGSWTSAQAAPPSPVRSLSVRTVGGTLAAYAVAGQTPTLYHLQGVSWTEVTDLPDAVATLAGVHVLESGEVLVGSNVGVLSRPTTEAEWAPLPAPADGELTDNLWVDPADGALGWRRTDGDVLRRAADGTWSTLDANLPIEVTSVAALPGRLVGIRGGQLVTVADGLALSQAPSFSPVAVVHVGTHGAAFVVGADCRVERLADPA